ncbi:hypothetical protein BH24GEM2_BH24GEM2_04710 [soil metagenome]
MKRPTNHSAYLLAALFAAACTPAPGVQPAAAPAPAPAAQPHFPTTAPALGSAPVIQVPDPVRRTLPNGLTVLYVTQRELPVVSATLVTRGGTSDDPANRPGLASFTSNMLDEGAGGKSALELANALDLLGASLSTGAGWDAAQVDLYVLRNNLPQALGLMADVVVRPNFPAREVASIRDERLTNLARARDEPTAIAANAYQSLVYGANHPYGRFATAEATRAIGSGQLVNFHRSFYRPGYATLVLAGDVDPETMHPMVERAFGGWQRGTGGTVAPVVTTAPTIGTTTIFLVDKPGAAQSEIRIGHPGVARDNPDYFPLLVLNTMLGGSFTSRLNTNLRETHGYSYGARSSFDMRRGAGPFTAQAAVVTAKTDSAVIEFFNELRRIRTEPIPEDELERAKRYVALGLPQRLETTSQVAGQLANLSVYGLDANFFEEYVPRVMAVTPEDVRRVANQHIRPDRSVVVVVGDRKTVEAGLRAIGLAPVEVRDVSHFVR